MKAAWLALIALGCGARTELEMDDGPSAAFCIGREYRGGWRDLSIYVLLDRSGSMVNDGKWGEATAAIASFVDDPKMAGLGVGLQYYPLPSACDGNYGVPAVAFGRLPENAAAVKSTLATLKPEGDTPMLPALRGAIEYARALLLGDPTHGVAIALTTDGAPNSCDSTPETVAAIAADGASGDPQVLTFVIGFESGYKNELAPIASAGGTTASIIIGGPNAAQELVDSLLAVRDNLLRCRYAVPAVPDAVIEPRDVSAAYRLEPGGAEHELARASGAPCDGDGFFVDEAATYVELCAEACATVHDSPTARVIVRTGCGGGGEPTLPPSAPCELDVCKDCPAVPHGCCRSDGTQAVASCIDGDWVCPPGSTIFGSPGCLPPAACAATLPCAFGSYCKLEDATCGEKELLGHCEPACTGQGPQVCACNGQTYPNACAASQAGQDISAFDSCQTPPGTFACGPYFCTAGSQLCLDVATPGDLVKDRYECAATSCASCNGCHPCPPCPPNKLCTETCSFSAGGVTVECTQL